MFYVIKKLNFETDVIFSPNVALLRVKSACKITSKPNTFSMFGIVYRREETFKLIGLSLTMKLFVTFDEIRFRIQ